MNSRPIAATFFVVFCLLLCGLILRRQIAAHPLPPDTGRPGSSGQGSSGQGSSGQGGSGQDPWTERSWQPAPPALAKQVQGVVQAEIAALRGGNTPKAMSYGSQARRQRFPDPAQFLQLMQERHPELWEDHTVRYSPVSIDQEGQNVWAIVLLRNRSGERTRDDFLMVREGGVFKINHIQTRTLPK